MTLYKGTTPIAGLSTNKIVTGFNILDCKWSDHIINDIQWLRADTFSWQSGDVYVTAYNKLVEEYSTGTEETEGSITFRRSSNNFKIATSDMESAILNKYNSDGISWYYILDTANKRFKLPRTKFGFEGLRTNVGDDIAESLPNIKGSFYSWRGQNQIDIGDICGQSTGAFWRTTGTQQYYITDTVGSSTGTGAMNFDASLSSSTYQDNAPVQERATQMYLYFYVGEYTRDAIEQTAGITSEELNSKADIETVNTLSTTVDNKLNKDHSNDTKSYLKTCYINGTSGYNIWSNGYCEQWGRCSGSYIQVSLPKTYKDTNYNIQMTWSSTSEGTMAYAASGVRGTVGTNYFETWGTGGTGFKFWRASGYLASDQY